MSRGVIAASTALVLTVGCGPPRTWVGLSPDHAVRLEVSDSAGLSCLTRNGIGQGCFRGVSLDHVVFSDDSRHLAYPVLEEEGWLVVSDGRRGAIVDGVGEILFSPDGERLAYAALANGRWHAVVDEEFGQDFDSIFSGSMTFDPTSRRLAYAASLGGRAVPVVDAVLGPAADAVGGIRFSRSGASVGYVARQGNRAALFVDGRRHAEHDAISEFGTSASGRDVVYAAAHDGAWWVHDASDTFGPYLEVRDLTHPEVGGALTFVVRDDEGERVVRDGRPGRAHNLIESVAFSDSGSTWGYIGRDSTTSSVFLDGVEASDEVWATDLTFNPSGTRYAYIAGRGGLMYVVHDQGERGYDVVAEGTLVFLRDGETWACLTGDFDGEDLYVAVEGSAMRRPFSWRDFGLLANGGPAASNPDVALAALRGWVAVEAEMLAEDVSRMRDRS